MSIDQIAIFVFGVTGVWLSQDRRFHVRRFGSLFGFTAQPFWFYTTLANEQWGIFAMSFVYTWAWAKGIYNNWYLPYKESKS